MAVRISGRVAGAGDQFGEVEVAGRIKEMDAEEMFAEFVGISGGDLGKRDAAGCWLRRRRRVCGAGLRGRKGSA